MIDELIGDLDPVQARVLGCLVEKEATTPDVYPMTTNSLVSACNQKTSRDPVVSFTAVEIDTALLSMRELGLVRMVRQPGSRSTKHRHVLQEKLELSDPQVAVLAVLFLRSAQTPGELRGRTERILEPHVLNGPEDAERVLESLAAKGVVTQLARQPGQKETRWMANTARGDAPPAGADSPASVGLAPTRDTASVPAPAAASASARSVDDGGLAEVKAELADLKRRFELLCDALGEHPE